MLGIARGWDACVADLLGIGDGIPIGPVSKKSWFAANSAYCRAEELDDTETQKVTPFGGRSYLSSLQLLKRF